MRYENSTAVVRVIFQRHTLGRRAIISLALMYGPLILMSLTVGDFTILRFPRTLCVLRLRRCLTGSLATGSTLRLHCEEKEANYLARETIVATSASVALIKILQYITTIIDYNGYFYTFIACLR